MAQMNVQHNPPVAFCIAELPQRDHMAYCIHLLYSDGEEQQIGISGTKRGCRQSLRNHRGLRHLPERVIEHGALVATVAAVARTERI
jgi:hypothetical protein